MRSWLQITSVASSHQTICDDDRRIYQGMEVDNSQEVSRRGCSRRLDQPDEKTEMSEEREEPKTDPIGWRCGLLCGQSDCTQPPSSLFFPVHRNPSNREVAMMMMMMVQQVLPPTLPFFCPLVIHISISFLMIIEIQGIPTPSCWSFVINVA